MERTTPSTGRKHYKAEAAGIRILRGHGSKESSTAKKSNAKECKRLVGVGGIAKFTTEELESMRAYDAEITRQDIAKRRKIHRKRLAYQKRYDKAHKEEIKVKQHEYYLQRKTATRLQSDNGAEKNNMATL